MNSITQDMKYRYSLMKYVEKHGVAKASRRYNKGRSYIYYWKARFDGSIESLACQSRKPHSHPNQHTEAELTLIRNMRRRNPPPGHRGALGKAAKTRLHPPCRKPVAGAAPGGTGGEGKAQEEVYAQALRTNAAARPANSDRCEGRTAKLHRGSAAEAVPVYCHRRILTISNPGRLSGAEHLFIRRFSSQGGCFLCPQRRED